MRSGSWRVSGDMADPHIPLVGDVKAMETFDRAPLESEMLRRFRSQPSHWNPKDRDYKLSAEEAKTVRSGAQPLSQEARKTGSSRGWFGARERAPGV